MLRYKIGDLVVLTSGSMRMVVEDIEPDRVSTVWCNEGVIGRDNFPPAVLKKWEYKEDEKFKATRSGKSRANEKYESNESARNDKVRGKTGWDGKSREKKFFRKD